MKAAQESEEKAHVRVENVGGITESEVSFEPGLTVLEGRNATNRSSLLHALMAACGSDDVTIKGDSEEGLVELTVDDESYTRTLQRRDGAVHTGGDPYLDDPTFADLFAFLIESNEARRAVARGDDLRELVMRPVDTDEIEGEIDRLLGERDELEAELEEIESLERELPDLEEERAALERQIEEKREAAAEKRSAIEGADDDVEEKREEEAALEERLEELRGRRSRLEDVRYEVETERETLDALRKEESELQEEFSGLPDEPAEELRELESAVGRLRDRKQGIESEINELQSIVQFNEEMLQDPPRELVAALRDEEADADGSVTDELLEAGRTACLSCGSDVEVEQIEATVDALRELSRKKLDRVQEIQEELDELKARRSTLQQNQQRRDEIEERLGRIDRQIDRQESSIEDLEAQQAGLEAEIEEIEADVEELETESDTEVLDLYGELNQIEYEIGRLESDLDRVEERISSIEDRQDDRESIEARRDAIREDITDLRTKIERIAQQAVDGFNEHMDSVLDLLEYENVERIWLERVETEVREGRRTVSKNAFELHVVRNTESGTTYEDTVDHLSESEREVTGLVFALAGYLAHEVYEEVPFLLLDSLEAIDGERIAKLIDYLSSYSDYLVVALLPEDASAIGGDYRTVAEV